MTGDDIAPTLRIIGWNRSELARRLHCDEKAVRRWENGTASLPPAVAQWLGQVARAIERLPPPPRWRDRQ